VRLHSTLLAGFLVACATGETPGDDVDMLSQTAGSAGSAGSFNNTSGSAQGGSGSSSGTGGSSAGSFSGGGMPSSAGTFSNGGTSFSGSTFGGGTAGAASGGGGATAGGAGGSGGTAGSGGKATGGAGAGGMGGAPATGCPAKTAWTATASIHAMDCPTPDATGDYCAPPSRAIDGVANNRFSTGTARTGNEWLQIDFGKTVTVSGLTLRTANGSTDFTLAYAVRMSNNAADIGTTTAIVSGAGMQGTTTIDFPAAKQGRYLGINQTMAMAGWWSVAELDVDCE
jgi:hypothetical protein